MDDLKTTLIRVLGLGGGGSNAVNRMMELGLEGIEFIAANTDAQALAQSMAPTRIQMGPLVTHGLGAGGKPEVGEGAAEESREEIKAVLQGADLVFLTAGMGGGTGTGAIPVAAEVARSLGALTVAIVTLPFTFEAMRRRKHAESGLAKLRSQADCLITVPNDKLLGLLPRNTPLELALRVADDVLRQGMQGITELINKPGLINIDFANIRTLMKVAGSSMMAIGHGRGEEKALEAVRQALTMPLLDVHSVSGAAGVLVHFTGGEDLALYEVSRAADEVARAAPQADVLFGATVDPLMNGRVQVILVATGIESRFLADEVSRDHGLRRPNAARDTTAVNQSAHLAEALFSQAVGARPVEQPFVVADTPAAGSERQVERATTSSEARSGAAGAAAQSSLDIPAFLRRRRSLRDYEGGS